MNESILATYNELYKLTIEMTAAIKEKKWEQVNLLTSKREGLFQKTNAFVSKIDECDDDLRKQIASILEKIKAQDDANMKIALEQRVEMNRIKAQYNVSNRFLNAYKQGSGRQGRSVDKLT